MNQQLNQHLKDNAAQLAAEYAKTRDRLSPIEQPLFDKAVQLLQETSGIESQRVILLDMAVSVGMLAVGLHPIAADKLLALLNIAILAAITLDASVKANPSFNN